jgi:predicted DNA-binding transcriptional regulator AlpA
MKKTDALPAALQQFDSLPDAANVRANVVAGLFGCSLPTIWRMVNRGTLKARKLSERVTCFNVGELRAALSATR